MRAILMCRGFYLDRARGDYKEALKNLDLAEHPVWPPAVLLFRGFMYSRLGQPDRALADFKKLMDIVEVSRPDFFALEDFVCRWLLFLLGRGEAYLARGDLEHALADSDEAVRFAPSSAEARLLRPGSTTSAERPTLPTPTAAQPHTSSPTRSSPYPIRDHRAPTNTANASSFSWNDPPTTKPDLLTKSAAC